MEIFSYVSNQDACADMTKALRQIKNIPIHLRRLTRGRGGHKEWRALVDVSFELLISTELMIGIGRR